MQHMDQQYAPLHLVSMVSKYGTQQQIDKKQHGRFRKCHQLIDGAKIVGRKTTQDYKTGKVQPTPERKNSRLLLPTSCVTGAAVYTGETGIEEATVSFSSHLTTRPEKVWTFLFIAL